MAISDRRGQYTPKNKLRIEREEIRYFTNKSLCQKRKYWKNLPDQSFYNKEKYEKYKTSCLEANGNVKVAC